MFRTWSHAPFCDLEFLTGGLPALILAPHPDDESLGFGGMIALARSRGAAVHVAILTDGTGSHPNSRTYPAPRLKRLREEETLRAVRELGLDAGDVTFLGAKDTAAPHWGENFTALASEIEVLMQRRGLRSILTTWQHDPHCDHEAASLLAAAVARATGYAHLAVPVWGWTLPGDQLLPGPMPAARRLDIGSCLPQKRRAIAAHVSQTTALISDADAAFRLEPEFLQLFDRQWEVFLWV